MAIDVSALLAIIGDNIRRSRVGLKMTQSSLSAKSGVSRSTIGNMEKGKSIELDNLIRLALTLGIPPDVLFIEPGQLSQWTIQARTFWQEHDKRYTRKE